MNKLKIGFIAFPGASKDVFKRGEEILKNKVQNIEFELEGKNPDAIFIITGGSENQAKKLLKGNKRILLLAITENNSYAASSEIKAYCNQNKIDSVLYNIDVEKDLETKLNYFITCTNALKKISSYKIGLIGEVSEWLISSNIDQSLLLNKFGLQLQKIAWNEFPEYSTYTINKEFLNHFNHSEFDLEDSSKVYNLLHEIVKTKQLDAITVECFPLVRENAVTACLALSSFNTHGLPAGCEGDITSITGKILLKELTGKIPWMANMAALEDEKVFFAHCTIATDLVTDYTINTHFETNQGTAVQGQFKSESATVFRLNNDLSKAFLSFGKIVEKPNREDSCRTQIKLEIPTNDIQKLKDNPLGNHHLILPGDHRELIEYFLKMSNIDLI
jgi:L-fucose isomerase-like protein